MTNLHDRLVAALETGLFENGAYDEYGPDPDDNPDDWMRVDGDINLKKLADALIAAGVTMPSSCCAETEGCDYPSVIRVPTRTRKE